MKIVEKTTFQTEDGKIFDTREAAEAHVRESAQKASLAYNKFLYSYQGSRLLEEHNLKEFGIWEVLGENENPDLGGFHHRPSLGLFEGTLDAVIKKAVSIPRFYTWGGGGTIRKQELTKVEKL